MLLKTLFIIVAWFVSLSFQLLDGQPFRNALTLLAGIFGV
jgi:hypothetical protein